MNKNYREEQSQLYPWNFLQNTTDQLYDPLFTSSFRHFSDQPDDHIYLSVCLETTGKTKKDFAIIALPVQSYGRFIRIPGDDDRICLMFLDDIVRFCLPLIFNGRPYDHFAAPRSSSLKTQKWNSIQIFGTALCKKYRRG